MDYQSLSYATDGRVATVTLSRPERLNAIDEHMPGEVADAVDRAEADDDIHVVVVTGAGRAFLSGYDLEDDAEKGDAPYAQDCPGTACSTTGSWAGTPNSSCASSAATSRPSPRSGGWRWPVVRTSLWAATRS